MEKLFTEFSYHSAADWKEQLIKELKGENYENLRWQNENGFTVEPFYTRENLHQSYAPAFWHSDWEITVKAKAAAPAEINKQLLANLNSGATAISLDLNGLEPGAVLHNVKLNFINATFFINERNASSLSSWLEKKYKPEELRISFFAQKLATNADLKAWCSLWQSINACNNIRCLSIDVLPFHNLNCTASYEVALAMAGLLEYLAFYDASKPPPAAFVVKTGVNADYFVQMSKLRAMRRLWELLRKEYCIDNQLYLIAETGLTNKSISDRYNNLLRTTVEAMGAVAGGCNELLVSGFDVLLPTDPALSERMAINQQLVLKHESYLDKMADVACGSYYIETLTDAIAAKALDKLKDIEKSGGYFACLEKGLFQSEIREQALKKQSDFDAQKNLAVGVNKYRNDRETLNISPVHLKELKTMNVNNPVLNFELQNFFTENAKVD